MISNHKKVINAEITIVAAIMFIAVAVSVASREAIIESFIKNFIREDRWKMILSGLIVTLKISVFTGISGTVLGIVICSMNMSKSYILTGLARIYIKFLQGTPTVVLLMVMYYVIFSKFEGEGFWISVIAFSMDFAAYTSEIFRKGVEAVPDGQMRAARALGFGKARGFLKVVLPQAMLHILPVYSGQFISMVKLTSVAGYVYIEDLTRVSDIIRSKTFEAFFPLITTAIIYFIMAMLMIQVLNFIERRIDPKTRKRKTGEVQ